MLTTPTGLTGWIEPDRPGEVQLAWLEVPEPVEGYQVYRQTELIATVSTVSYTDPDVPEGSWLYQVQSYQLDPDPTWSELSSPVTVWADWTAPTGATELTGMVRGLTTHLTWSVATDTVGLAGYELVRAWTSFTGLTAAPVTITLASTVLATVDGPLPAGWYRYQVWAVDYASNRSVGSNLCTLEVHTFYPVRAQTAGYRTIYPGGLTDRWVRTGYPLDQQLAQQQFDQLLEAHGRWWVYARLDWTRPCHRNDYDQAGSDEWHADCLGQGYRLIWHKVRARDMGSGGGSNLAFDLTESRLGQTIWSWAWLYPRPQDLIFEVDWDVPEYLVLEQGQPVRLLAAYQINHVDYPKGPGGQRTYSRMFGHPLVQPWARYEQVLRQVRTWTELAGPSPDLGEGLRARPGRRS